MDGALTPNAGEADRAVNVQPLIATRGNGPAEPTIPGLGAHLGCGGHHGL